MDFSFIQRLFGEGEVDSLREQWRQCLAAEGVLQAVTDVRTAVTYRNYRRPGKFCSWNRKLGYTTDLIITQQRMVAIQSGQMILNLPFGSELWQAVSVTLSNQDTLRVVANVSAFRAQHQGEVELWFHTSQAQLLLDTIASHRQGEAAEV